MSDVTTVPAQKPRRWPFYVSLFLNVVLITVLVLGMWRIHQFRRDFEGGPMGGWLPAQIERVLPGETAAKVKKIREAHADKVKALWKAAREARGAMRQALDADPLDVAALKAAVTATRDADAALATETGAIIVEMAENLTAAERMLVREKVKDLRKQPRRGKAGKDGRDDGPGPRGERRDGPPPGPPEDGLMPPPDAPPPGEGLDEPPPPPPAETPAPTP
ncbi:MAG: periplasmic heavy metal sensor [Micropepsaceae bacterium]